MIGPLPDSRIWIYQSDKELSQEQSERIETVLGEFTAQWAAHGKPLAASAVVEQKRFVVLSVDESVEIPSGCSIDTSVHLLRKLGEEMNTDFFDRKNIAYLKEDNAIGIFAFNQTAELLAQGTITPDTLIFDNTIQRLRELEHKWMIPLKDSWLKKYIKNQKA